jgi:hypothetical protein
MSIQQAVALGTLERFGDAGVVIATPLHTIVMRPDKNWNAATNSDNGISSPLPSPSPARPAAQPPTPLPEPASPYREPHAK